MARNKPKAVKLKDGSQEGDGEGGSPVALLDAEPARANGAKISKVEAVRRAIVAGTDSLDDGIDFVLKKFGIEMTKAHFSAAKSILKKKGVLERGRPGRRPARVESPSRGIEGDLAPPPRRANPAGEVDMLGLMESLKPMVAQLGADKVKRIVDLLG